MALFMLTRHNLDRARTRSLLDEEIEAAYGGTGDAPPTFNPGDCDSTMCDCTIITPGGDGEPMMDCDGG
ncbi:MAG: hypothetical protein ACFE0P_08920 [Oceanicaulis sp.]